MKNDNKLVQFTVFVLLIAMVTLIILSGTYAKYTTSVSGSDTATVAKWSIKVNDNEIAVDNSTVTIDLFKTIYDTDGTTAETDVKTGKYIAPGTSGKFDLKVENDSDVTAKYSIAFTLSDTTLPIEFSTDGGKNWSTSLSDVASTTLAVGSNAVTTTVQWRWTYESGADATAIATKDKNDTAIGIAAQTEKKLTVTAKITAEQVD